MSRALLVAIAVLVLVGAAVVLRERGGESTTAVVLVASEETTPGVVNPDVTQVTIGTTICVPGFSRSIRPPSSYTSDLKRQQMRANGLTGSMSDYQEDHLISLELGGHPTDPRNLWPEPYPRAATVDRLENDLHARVCAREMTLEEAQLEESRTKHTKG